MSVTRYDVVPWDRYRTDALPRDGGAWVRYDDHAAEVGQWAATVDRVTRERDDEHLARVTAEARVRELRELLAVVNGDGGQHDMEVGTQQAVQDAIATYHALEAKIERLQDRVGELSNKLMLSEQENVEWARRMPHVLDRERFLTRFLHAVYTARNITLDQARLNEAMVLLDAWGRAHSQGNGEEDNDRLTQAQESRMRQWLYAPPPTREPAP